MKEIALLKKRIIALEREDSPAFNSLALEVFHLQYRENEIYRTFCELLKIDEHKISRVEDIPFLPISFFKNFEIKSGAWDPVEVFRSSGTTGMERSQHFVKSIEWYYELCVKGFLEFYGDPSDYVIIGLLPSYSERADSSLISMVNLLQNKNISSRGKFFMDDYNQLNNVIENASQNEEKLLIIGVTFALLDWAEKLPLQLNNTILMETGGMKGRKEELVRSEVHNKLKAAFQLLEIHSEYGMTELFSQAYSTANGYFYPASTMKLFPRQITDPLSNAGMAEQAAINVIDLGNIDTCSFIATDDVGRVYEDGGFEILGRLDQSDIRGCNLMFAGG
jgi:hypothetical protein